MTAWPVVDREPVRLPALLGVIVGKAVAVDGSDGACWD